MAENGKRVLERMLDRLFAAIVNGPSLNCRPHSSRQRVDLASLARLGDISADEALRELLGPNRKAKVRARHAAPRRRPNGEAEELSDEDKAALEAWGQQQTLLNKLRAIAEDAKTYEQDTGVYVLDIGFPLLSMPPGTFGGQRGVATRRIIAPLAFVPVSLVVKAGASPAVELECRGGGIDLVRPNMALLAWLTQQTGKEAADLFEDEEGKDPWREIAELVRQACAMLEMEVPMEWRGQGTGARGQEEAQSEVAGVRLVAAPRGEELESRPAIISAAVLGLFPMANQGLLRDMQAMAGGEALAGPVESFVRADVSLEQPVEVDESARPVQRRGRVFAEERLVAAADPCQSRAVRLARECRGLVIHGPPGTGKSQTITNIIGDHLWRGQRVLLVCDKRTALDVVAHRMEHLGLGRLCAVVHDPQRDQRELYRSIHQQLDDLPEASSDEKAGKRLEKIDAELQRLHGELSEVWEALMHPADGAGSFHELMGQWLALGGHDGLKLAIADLTMAQVEGCAQGLADLLQRGLDVGYPDNGWVKAAGLGLEEFLTSPMTGYRAAMGRCVQAAKQADATADGAIPPFLPDVDLPRQAEARAQLAQRLAEVLEKVDEPTRQRWAARDAGALRRAGQKLGEVEAALRVFHAGALDAELTAVTREQAGHRPILRIGAIARDLAALEAYLQTGGKWYSFLYFKRKRAAAEVLGGYGLPLEMAAASRLRDFLTKVRARLVLQTLVQEFEPAGGEPPPPLMSDDLIDAAIAGNGRAIELLCWVQEQAPLSALRPLVAQAMANGQAANTLIEGLRRSHARATAIAALEQTLADANLFEREWGQELSRRVRAGELAGETLTALEQRIETLEGVLRIRQELPKLPGPLRGAARDMLAWGTAVEDGLRAVRREVVGLEIARRIKDTPTLQGIDAQRLKGAMTRYRKLETEKRQVVRDAILHHWIDRQKQRLLASTGSRLNGMGADLRRRLVSRGQRAMRLRQVVAIGERIEDGDPLFDLRPVWMASPETVAQVFARRSAFDVVIFDEASQCRLEEALPVLLRGRRVVISGDPRQLPPTRFFESAVAVSDDEEIETEQQLFEVQQGEVEDLLSAALNLSIEQSYLDVHYRSRNADLIAFSNEHFYSSRLQAIPGHPSRHAPYAPLTLHRVNGVYDKRQNVAEAEAVCRIVRDLLMRAEPPSIGVACFNLQQRDLIVEKLDELAAEDPEFAARLAEARRRVGAGTFEGLFVKNLENVQGDERDHIIISTTYGPDPNGRFHRRFGPLGRAGGGRRLNVLVTRARHQVHLLSSIPPEVYRNLPPVPAGQSPGGGWLLFAYLAYAEELAKAYEARARGAETPHAQDIGAVRVNRSRWPSRFAEALAGELLKRHGVGSDVHWGNDGFCVDLALRRPDDAGQVTIGVLCDGARFGMAADPVEWDVFRTAIHESQGWRLQRLWTPQYFRDPEGCIAGLVASGQT